MNALMLALAVRLLGGRIRLLRVMAGAFAGAALAWAAAGASREITLLLWLPAAMMMMRIALGRETGKSLMIHALVLLCAAGLLGGMVLCFWGETGSLTLAYAFGAVAAAGIGAAQLKLSRRQRTCTRMACVHNGRRAEFEAMIDSGNTLRDYLTHLPVIVIAESAGRNALGLGDALLRPIFAQTAGGRQQMAVFAPQEVILNLDDGEKRVQAVVALSPGMSAGMPALVPAELVDGLWNSSRGG